MRAIALSALIFAHFELGDAHGATTDYHALLEALGAVDTDDAAVRAGCLRMAAFGPAGWARDHIDESIRIASEAGLAATVNVATSQLAMMTCMEGRLRDAEALADQVHGDPQAGIAQQNALLAHALCAQNSGRLEEARVHFESLGRILTERRHPRLIAFDTALVVLLDLAQGRDSGAAGRLDAVLADARRRGFVSGIASAGWAPGAWALGHGDVRGAVELLLAWRSEFTSSIFLGRTWMPLIVESLLAAGDVAAARDELESIRSSSMNDESNGQGAPRWGGLTATGAVQRARVSTNEAVISRAEGDPGTAERSYHDALTTFHELGWRPEVVHCLEALAGIAAINESHVECARLAGAAERLRDDMGYVLRWPYEQRLLDADLALVRVGLGEERFDAAFSEGHVLDDDAAVAYARRARGERKRPSAGWSSLTPTELAVAGRVADGLTNKEVARELLMGAETVKTHLSHVYDKLGIHNRAALAAALVDRRHSNGDT